MPPPNVHVVAGVFSCVAVGAIYGVAWWLRASSLHEFRRMVRDAIRAGTLPKQLEGTDLDRATPEGWDTDLPPNLMVRYGISKSLTRLWFLWVPLIVAVCFAWVHVAGAPARE